MLAPTRPASAGAGSRRRWTHQKNQQLETGFVVVAAQPVAVVIHIGYILFEFHDYETTSTNFNA